MTDVFCHPHNFYYNYIRGGVTNTHFSRLVGVVEIYVSHRHDSLSVNIYTTKYFVSNCCLFLERMEFLGTWKNISAENEYQSIIEVATNHEEAEKRLEANNIFQIAHRKVNDQDLLYMSANFINNIRVLVELKITPNSNIQVRKGARRWQNCAP